MKRRVYTKFLGICISPEMDDRLTHLSDEGNFSKSEMTRILLQRALDVFMEEDNLDDEQ